MAEFTKAFVKDKPLVFVQHSMGDDFDVYQDGEKVEGLRTIQIRAGLHDYTEHEIEYVTGATKRKEDE